MRRLPLFLRHTPVGDCTSSEEVPDAWSLSPSEPIFRFSWTMSWGRGEERQIEEREKRMSQRREGASMRDRARAAPVETCGKGGEWLLAQHRLMTSGWEWKDQHSLWYFYGPLCSYQALALGLCRAMVVYPEVV